MVLGSTNAFSQFEFVAPPISAGRRKKVAVVGLDNSAHHGQKEALVASVARVPPIHAHVTRADEFSLARCGALEHHSGIAVVLALASFNHENTAVAVGLTDREVLFRPFSVFVAEVLLHG